MAAADNEASVRRYWDEFWTKGNLDAAADFYAPKYRENGEELTPEEFAAGAKSWMDKFENFSATVEKLWACGRGSAKRGFLELASVLPNA